MINLKFHSTNENEIGLSAIRNSICENAKTQIEDGDIFVSGVVSDSSDSVFTLSIKTSNDKDIINVDILTPTSISFHRKNYQEFER